MARGKYRPGKCPVRAEIGVFHAALVVAGHLLFQLGKFLRVETRRAQLLGEQPQHRRQIGAQALAGKIQRV